MPNECHVVFEWFLIILEKLFEFLTYRYQVSIHRQAELIFGHDYKQSNKIQFEKVKIILWDSKMNKKVSLHFKTSNTENNAPHCPLIRVLLDWIGGLLISDSNTLW